MLQPRYSGFQVGATNVAHPFFYLRPERYDRRKIRRIFRQEFNSAPNRLNRFGDGSHLMREHIVHINNVARLKRWAERLVDKKQHDIAIDSPWRVHHRTHAINRQGSNGKERCGGAGLKLITASSGRLGPSSPERILIQKLFETR